MKNFLFETILMKIWIEIGVPVCSWNDCRLVKHHFLQCTIKWSLTSFDLSIIWFIPENVTINLSHFHTLVKLGHLQVLVNSWTGINFHKTDCAGGMKFASFSFIWNQQSLESFCLSLFVFLFFYCIVLYFFLTFVFFISLNFHSFYYTLSWKIRRFIKNKKYLYDFEHSCKSCKLSFEILDHLFVFVKKNILCK